jgi:cytidine deaminase
MNHAALIASAEAARGFAHAPYSGFKVGAALETDDGEIISGCNIENATLGLTMCAERVALFKAISMGKTRFVRCAIATAAEKPTPPCGSCRQLLWEFAGDVEILLTRDRQLLEAHRLQDLFPLAFDRTHFQPETTAQPANNADCT